ncbi:MAG TPA: PEGA domain-containing protein [Kofleriaceae bacterium]|nr:PEGA domain-containing protein [Kofleriaceae bacterium]
MIRRAACALAVLVGLVAAPRAHADDRAAAERYFRAGAKAYAQQSFAAAAADFDEAYANLPVPEIAFSAAQAYRRLYRVDPDPRHVHRAIELYRAYLARVTTGGRVGDAADNLAEMERELDKLRAAGKDVARSRPTAHDERTRLGIGVAITDPDPGPDPGPAELGPGAAAVREIGDAGAPIRGLTAVLDGKPVEPFALIEVVPGEHRLAVTADGYLPAEKVTRAIAGQAQIVELELRPRPARVAVTTEADARITVDGRAVATAPAPPLELAAGKHLVTILRRGREPFSREIVVTRGQAVALRAPLAPTARRRAVPYFLAGAGLFALGALATGTVALVHDARASDLRDQIALGNRPPGDGDRFVREVTARDHDVTATWLLGGAALAAGAAGALALWLDTPTAEPPRMTPALSVAAGGAGVGVAGRF